MKNMMNSFSISNMNELKIENMKRIILVALLVPILQNVSGQKISASKVPAAVTSSFKNQYADVKSVTWELENGNFEANFKRNGTSTSVVYDKNGSLLETEVDIKVSELPASVGNYVKSHYKTKIKEASKITKPNGEVNYEATLKQTEVIFDENGNFLKEIKEEKEAKEKK